MPEDSERTLRRDERIAWTEYLEAVRGSLDHLYEETETWAWAKLETRLNIIGRKRDKIAA